jgi:hypothetical protein
MATSKTLTPTNQTISIPALGDAPDASVFSNCIEKEADAINTLNSHFVTISSGSLHDILKTGMYYLTAAVTDKPTAAGGYYSVTVFSNDLLVGMFCSLDGNIANIRYANGTWTVQKTPSFRVVEGSQTTGATGNIALGEYGSDKCFIVAVTALNADAYIRAWRATGNQTWYLTAVNPNTGAAIANTQIDYRYMAIDLY